MYKRILVPFDGSLTATQGLRAALSLAGQSGGRLKLIYVIDDFVGDSAMSATMYYNWIDQLRDDAQSVLDAGAALASSAGVAVETEVVETLGPRTAAVIVEHARSWSADLIAMGTHGRRGLRRVLLGSDAEAVMRTAPVPVLVVRAEQLAA